VRKDTRETDIPLARLAPKGNSLDFALDGTMQFNADHANMLNAKPITVQSNAVAISRECEAVVAVSCLEARIAWLLSGLETAEETLKCFVQSPHCVLSRREVETREVRIGGALAFEPCRLIGVLHRTFLSFVSRFSLFQASIVEPAMRLQHNAEFTLLIGVR